MQMLVQKGADIRSEDSNLPTPLMLLYGASDQRDPLKISLIDKFIFFSTLLMWSSRFVTLQKCDWKIVAAFHLLCIGSYSISSFLKYASTYTSQSAFFRDWVAGMVINNFFSHNRIITTLFSTYRISRLATNLFSGLKSCWKNASFSRGKALLKAVVSHGPTGKMSLESINDLFHQHFPPDQTPFSEIDKLKEKANVCGMLNFNPNDAKRSITCMDKGNLMDQLCYLDPHSSKCSDASDDFGNYIGRIYNFDVFMRDYTKNPYNVKNETRQNYFLCYGDGFNSEECLKAEKAYNLATGFIKLDDCKAAAKLLTDDEGATFDKIKKTFREYVKANHPDKNKGKPTSNRYIEMSKAYEIAEKCDKKKIDASKESIPVTQQNNVMEKNEQPLFISSGK